MKKFLMFILIFLSVIQINITFGDTSPLNSKISSVYNLFVKKVENKYSIEKQFSILNKLDEILNKILENNNYSTEKIKIIEQFKYLNYEKIKKIQVKLSLINKAKNDLLEKQILVFNEKKFYEEYNNNSNKNILSKYIILNNFKFISHNKNNVFLEDGVWYYYKYSEFKYFENLDNIKSSDLLNNGINPNSSLVFIHQDNNIISFALNFEKIKLINDNIIYGIPNKYKILLEIKDDKKFLNNDTDILFKNLREETIKITNGLNKEEKIEILYKYILENNQYTKIIDLNNKKIFSGIELYKNKEGVCEAYAKLFMYMLSFAGINDIQIIRGYIIDASDFPEIGHAWIKIENKYYDPTFDDPVGLSKTLKFNEYKYFGLPKDLFYTNRYDYIDIPEILKTKDLEYRKLLISKNLFNVYDKYKNDNYQLLKETKFKKENNIKYNENITLLNLNKIIPEYSVYNYTFNKDGKVLLINKLNYFPINDKTIETLLAQINYNLDGYYFFKWYLDDKTFEYRLGYDLEIK